MRSCPGARLARRCSGVHPVIFDVFDDICRGRLPPGARVLEVGAMPAADTLLNLPALHAATLRVGVNLAVQLAFPGLHLVQVAADGLAAFADASFDAVLCNSVLEHDAYFWRTLDGIQRVARTGALIAIGVPGYADLPPPPLLRVARRVTRLPFVTRLLARLAPGWDAATPTLVVHNYPGDYYRFSEQAMREVLLAGCCEIEVRVAMRPPRIIGFGRREAASGAAAERPKSG
jgi:SAM-dependent methyltransferase